MKFNEYQTKATVTGSYPTIGSKLIYPVIGLSGECGELSEKVKKYFRDNTPKEEFIEGIIKEGGDVLWYLSEIFTVLNISLEYVAIQNLEKLQDRLNRGVIQGSGDDR